MKSANPTFEEVAATAAPQFAACIWQRYTHWVAVRKNPLDACTGFDWDEANGPKNWERHRVAPEEAEDIFFNTPLIIRGDVRHSKREKTRSGRPAPDDTCLLPSPSAALCCG